MNKSVKVIALCGVLGLTAVSCQKEMPVSHAAAPLSRHPTLNSSHKCNTLYVNN